nr:signal peptide peptidase SppA [Tessaracoccus coleopterorum]
MAWAESFGELVQGLSSYHLATAAQEIWLQPTGLMSIEGVELSMTLYKGLLAKVGVVPQFGQRHEYKTAANTYAADEITGPQREMTTRLGQSIVDSLVGDIARRRGLTTEQVWEAVNASPVTPEHALELGLIDHIGYRDQAYGSALERWGVEAGSLLFAHRYTNKAELVKRLRARQPKVAVVQVRGGITTGRGNRSIGGGASVGSDVVDEHLRAALRDDDVKAVVLAVDSPGGSAVASDFIRRSVLRLREAGKPVVAHMETVAASGGYYVAMPADEIVAHATTLTGSIGVLAGKMVTEGLYDRLGLLRETVEIGAAAGTFSSAHEFSDSDWERLNVFLDRVYRDFTTFAAQDRGMDLDDLEKLARGRVWTGADALERGLVDHIGGQHLAVERACALAGLQRDRTRLTHIGDPGFVAMLRPANSSEQAVGGANLPTPESMLAGIAAGLGINAPGPSRCPGRCASGEAHDWDDDPCVPYHGYVLGRWGNEESAVKRTGKIVLGWSEVPSCSSVGHTSPPISWLAASCPRRRKWLGWPSAG